MIRALALLAILSSSALADAPWLSRIAHSLQGAPGWKVDLAWTTKPAAGSLARPSRTEGELQLSADSRFRFVSEGFQALSDGTTAWQYTASTKQVLVQSVAKLDPTLLPGTLLKQALSGSETSSKRETLDGKDVVRLELATGKGALARFTRATLWARVGDLRPVRLLVADVQGTETIWDLVSWKRWKPGAGDFHWKAPKGSETVDLRN